MNQRALYFTFSTSILLRLLTVNVKNCVTPKSQSSSANATPSSGTSPLASYKEVPSPRTSVLAQEKRSN